VVVIFSVAVLPTGFMERSGKSVMFQLWTSITTAFHPVVIVVSPLNALDQIDAKNIRMSLRKRIAFSK